MTVQACDSVIHVNDGTKIDVKMGWGDNGSRVRVLSILTCGVWTIEQGLKCSLKISPTTHRHQTTYEAVKAILNSTAFEIAPVRRGKLSLKYNKLPGKLCTDRLAHELYIISPAYISEQTKIQTRNVTSIILMLLAKYAVLTAFLNRCMALFLAWNAVHTHCFVL